MRVLLIVVSLLVSAACGASRATPSPFPRPSTAHPPASPPADPVGDRPTEWVDAGGYEISGTALSLRGAPYRDGGADPRGFDCSGLVWYVFAQHGVQLPRTVIEQARVGQRVGTADLLPGDLVFFSTTAAGPSHVGIIVGGDSFVHAPSSTGVVRVERISAPYWTARFVGGRRVN